jgi:uncharacterized membrane protein YeiB
MDAASYEERLQQVRRQQNHVHKQEHRQQQQQQDLPVTQQAMFASSMVAQTRMCLILFSIYAHSLFAGDTFFRPAAALHPCRRSSS